MAEYFSITTPKSWFELELRPDRRDTAVKDLVNERVREIPELWEHRSEIVRVLRRYARNAWESGARFASAFAQPAEGTTLTGCLTVTSIPAPPGGGDDLTEDVVERLTATSSEPGDETWTTVSIVDIDGVGRCARSFGVEDVTLPDDAGWVRVVSMQTFVPAPTGGLLLVSASSPDLDVADDLLELFDAVTATVRVGVEADAPAGASR